MELALLGKKPVEKNKPAGSDVRNDTLFDDLQTEVSQAVSVHGVLGDWENIVRIASTILDQKSKNLIVAGYLAVGLIYTKKTKGFLTGAQIYLDLIENYWGSLYPVKSRPRGRSRAISWWVEKTSSAVKSLPANSITQEQADQMWNRMETVQKFLRKELEECPSFRGLMEGIRDLGPSTHAEPIPDNSFSQNVAEAKPESTEDKLIFTDSDASQSLKFLTEQASKLATYHLVHDKANPLSYRLNRFAMWTNVDELPPATDGQTRIPAPDGALIDRLQKMQDEGNYEVLLTTAEDEAIQSIFWFDLHYYSYLSLANLGDNFAIAANVVAQETAAFARRLPGIENLSFADGKPFAMNSTRLWLQQMKGGSESPGVEQVPSDTKSSEQLFSSDEVNELKKLLKTKKISQLVQLFQEKRRGFSAGRDKFLWNIEFALLSLKSKHHDLLSAQIAQILDDIEKYQLDSFDPALALKGLSVALKSSKQGFFGDAKKNAKDILLRIAKIDLNEYIRKGGFTS